MGRKSVRLNGFPTVTADYGSLERGREVTNIWTYRCSRFERGLYYITFNPHRRGTLQ